MPTPQPRIQTLRYARLQHAVYGSYPPRTRFVSRCDGYCAAEYAAKVDEYMAPKLNQLGGSELELAQTNEQIAQCAALKQAKGAEISAAFAK